MDIDNEDEIAYEIDLIISKPQGNLKFIQYPLIPITSKVFDKISLSSFEKKGNKYNLEVFPDFSLSKQNQNQSRELKENKEIHFFTGEIIESNTNYCIGVYNSEKNELSLSNIKEFIQFRPSQDNALVEGNIIKQGKKSNQIGGNIPSQINQVTQVKSGNVNNLNIKYRLFNISSIESKMNFDLFRETAYSSNKIQLSQTNFKFLSYKEYYDLILKSINQITVAEEIYKHSTNTLSYKDIQLLPLNSKIKYLFSKSSVLSLYEIFLLTKSENEVIEEYSKSLLKFLSHYAHFASQDILVFKSELLIDCPTKQKKRNHLLPLLIVGCSKQAILKSLVGLINSHELSEYLHEIGEYFNGKWYLKGYIKNLNVVQSLNISNLSGQVNQFKIYEEYKYLQSYCQVRIKEDKEYFNEYKVNGKEKD